MRQQYHFKKVGSDTLIWDVNKLVELAEKLPVIDIPLADIGELDENFWFDTPGNVPTCRAIADHARLMSETDLRHPIILASDGSVMDGMHRVCKAYMTGVPRIKARKFTTTPEPHFVNIPEDALPYN